MKSLENEILKRLRGRGCGTAACLADFLDLGSRAAVDQVLSRLVKKGTLERVDRGDALPRVSRVLGRLSLSVVRLYPPVCRFVPAVPFLSALRDKHFIVGTATVRLAASLSRRFRLGLLPGREEQ